MNNEICKIHNEPALFFKQDTQQNQIYLCRLCEQQQLNIDTDENEEKQGLKQLQMKFDQSIKLLNNIAEVLEFFTQEIEQKLKKFKKQVEQSISYLNEKKNQVKNLSNDFTNLQLNLVNEQNNIINNYFEQIILQLNEQIQELEISTRLQQFYQPIEKLQQLENIRKCKVIDKKFNYELMQKSSYKQKQKCWAIAFNNDATIMIAGCDELIKVFELKNDKLKKIQKLSGHSNIVHCLQFMKKTNQFVSGSQDSTIIVWQENQNKLWQINQILKNHASFIFCLIINQKEDLLISASQDKTIKFLQKQNNSWGCIQSIDCKFNVFSISLNDLEDELIASVESKEILVIQFQGQEWRIKQYTSVEQYGYRLCFINQGSFVFQPIYTQQLQIFDYDAKDQTYKKVQFFSYCNQITGDDCFFPIKYLSKIGLILVKNGCHVHLIKRNWNGQLTVEQSINFNTYLIYGCVTNDGRYIATWDDKSKEIQIRKFEF